MKKISIYIIWLLSFIAILAISISTSKSNAQPQLVLTPVIATGLSAPMQLVNAGDGSKRVFIVQKGGTIRVYDSTFTYLADFLTVTGINTTGERGLLSMVFHPGYETNGFFYVYYTTTLGDLELARYHVSANANVADVSSKVVLITIPHQTNSNHNGGALHFGADDYLYLSTGDGGGTGDVPNNAQNTTVLLGKILRFAVNTSATAPYYTIPAENPYNNEIYDLGLRNPYRWSFDRLTNDMWIGDVGQDSWEEINYRPAASTANVNYGWRCYEGNATYNTTGCSPASSYVFPVHTYASQDPAASITGGLVYRGTASPLLQGWYLSADFYSGIFYKIFPDGLGGWTVSTQTLVPTGIVNFGETENGEAYAVSNTGNGVYNISATVVLPLSLVSFTATPSRQGAQLHWETAAEENIQQFELEYSMDGNAFKHLYTLPAKNTRAANRYDYQHTIGYDGSIFYRLKIVKKSGQSTYSGVVQVRLNNAEQSMIPTTFITDGILRVNTGNTAYRLLELVSMEGKVLYKENISNLNGTKDLNISHFAPGVYLVRLSGDSKSFVQKVFIQ